MNLQEEPACGVLKPCCGAAEAVLHHLLNRARSNDDKGIGVGTVDGADQPKTSYDGALGLEASWQSWL
jgi:hypothetical protein